MAKHTQTIRRQFADELFECVWPFYGIGAQRVNCRKLKRNGEIEKCYTINGIAHIAKNNKLMKLYHLKDLKELFPEYVFDNSDHAE